MRAVILSVLATMIVPAFLLANSPRVEPTTVQPRTQSDVLCFRTFTPDEFGSAVASDMDDVPLKWTATLVNTGATKVNHLTVTFSGKIGKIVSCTPFNRAERIPGQPLAWDLSGATISRGTTVIIKGESNVPKLTVMTWKWMYDLRQATRIKGSFNFTVEERGVVMPTPANIVEELFENQGTMRTSSSSQSYSADGIVLGIPRPDSTGSYAWVRLQSPIHTQLTLSARTGYVHTGTPRGLTNTSNGGRLVGEVHFLPPSRHDNKLVGSLLALKLNVIASSRGITPAGFESLIYGDESSPYYGMQISRIIRTADTMLTYFKGRTQAQYVALENALERINHAFCGPIDTISAKPVLAFTGVPNPEASRYLGIPFVTTPGTVHATPAVSSEQPVAFGLGQNYPNPFNPSTVIPFTIAEPAIVHLTVYNIIGQEVRVLINGSNYETGEHQVSFQADGLASGTYIYRLIVEPVSGGTQPFTSIKKMNIIQ